MEALAGNLDAARSAVLDAVELFLVDDDLAGLSASVRGLAALAARAGDDRTAVRLAAMGELLARQSGTQPPRIPILDVPLREAAARLSAEAVAAETEAATSVDARSYLEAEVAERGPEGPEVRALDAAITGGQAIAEPVGVEVDVAEDAGSEAE